MTDIVEELEAFLSTAHTLRARLLSRSRSETFLPGSLAPELLRRSEELLGEIDCVSDARMEIMRLRALAGKLAESLRAACAAIDGFSAALTEFDQLPPELNRNESD